MTYEELNDARVAILDLLGTLKEMHDRDPEQEVGQLCWGVIDAALKQAAGYFPGDPVVSEVREIVSPESIAAAEPVRVADMLPVVRALGTKLERRVSKLAAERRDADDF